MRDRLRPITESNLLAVVAVGLAFVLVWVVPEHSFDLGDNRLMARNRLGESTSTRTGVE